VTQSDPIPNPQYLTAEAVANWFINQSIEANQPFGLIKLQRLLFFAHGWCLALYGLPLLRDQVEAGDYAPVFPSIQKFGEVYGSNPVSSFLKISGSQSLPAVSENDPRIPLLQKIWEVYGKCTDVHLCRIATEKEGPWDTTRKLNPGRTGTNIPDTLLESHFKSLL